MFLKFRVWDARNKQMNYKDFCLIPTQPDWSATKFFDVADKIGFDLNAFDWADGDMISGEYSPMPYIGLDDSQGNPIYQCDIVEIDGEDPLDNEQFTTDYDWKFTGKIIYSDCCFWIRTKEKFQIAVLDIINHGNANIKVIGNTFENGGLV